MAQGNNTFDFNAFNAMTNNKPAGLQIALAKGLIHNALWTMGRFSNPLESDLQAVYSTLVELQKEMKAQSLARAKAAE